MSFWDKVKEDKWFAFASVTLAGIVVYLGYDNYTRRKNQLTYEGYHGQESVASNHARLKEGNILEFGPNARNEAEFPIYKICITGGPCAGKTTSIEEIKEIFSNRGYRVLVCPEIPTMIVLSGGMILMGGLSVDQRIHFQSLLIKLQIYIEDYFTKLAAMSKMPAIILCDRGTMDPYAYVTQDEFQAILDEENWNIVGLRDRRYDCVVFLVTAADGAEDYYTLSNNVARSEGIELARELDKKTQIAWNGHPHLTIVPNVKGETFKQKIQRAVHSVEKCVGINSENRYDTKYQVLEVNFPAGFRREVFEVEETFLLNANPETIIEDKVRKRGQNGSYTFSRTIKYRTKNDKDTDTVKRPLTALEYLRQISSKKDPKFKTLKKDRTTFIYEKQSFIIDKILMEEPVTLLRFSSKKGEEGSVKIPDFIKVGADVTKDKRYSTYQLALVH